MKALLAIINFLTFSNLFVSLCVVTYTHLTYLIYDLPKNNLAVVLVMVFSFTFFTYNGQRIYRLSQKVINPDKIGERLQWVIKNKGALTIWSIIFGIIGFVLTAFINPYCFIILVPMGGLSFFYVVPIIPFLKNTPAIREIPYLKIIVIGITWSIAIVWLPIMDASEKFELFNTTLLLALLQVFFFVVAITLPFDIRDMKFDELIQLKTLPRLLGKKYTVILSLLLLSFSLLLLTFLPISKANFLGLTGGHILTGFIIAMTNEKRKELFFSVVVEGTVMLLYSGVILAKLLL